MAASNINRVTVTGNLTRDPGHRFTPESDVPADTADFAPAPAGPGAADDDIPF
jgi:single-stranded DNA-binding protein